MLTISRMKSLMSASPFSLNLSKATPFGVFSLASKSPSNLIPTILQSSMPFHTIPRMISPKSPIFSIHNRSLQSESCRSSSDGEIHVIVGPMFAGKTTMLLRRIQCESENGRSVAIIKSNKDTRYRLDSIVTHDGLKLPCSALTNLSSFRQKFGLDAYDKLDVIGIDEAQFFDDLYDFCREAADHDGKTIIVAGLDGDYLRLKKERFSSICKCFCILCLWLLSIGRKSFGSVLHIIPLADSVTKLTARCEICSKRAFFTLRKTGEIQTELIGGADVYMPVCRQHYVGGQVALDAARILTETRKV